MQLRLELQASGPSWRCCGILEAWTLFANISWPVLSADSQAMQETVTRRFVLDQIKYKDVDCESAITPLSPMPDLS